MNAETPARTSTQTAIAVEVWSDLACPWCYIGSRRLEQAVTAFAQDGATPPVDVTYRSFQLMPDLPDDYPGSTVDLLVQAKGIPADQVAQMHDHVSGIAAEVGLRYDFAAQRPANTLKAHQVLHLAAVRGVQRDATERLFAAHFTEGRHIGRDDELAALGADVGLDPEEIRQVLAEGTYAAAVRRDIDDARELGISGVPFFVLDRRYGVSGAQPVEVLTGALGRAAADHADV
ncbi:DsbA family protein [Euzebya sp.]|uniref:DsbA family oxidoreductase n=1 Tax=Euzebya sp. TaxID=1971409 RepID=UPI003517E612